MDAALRQALDGSAKSTLGTVSILVLVDAALRPYIPYMLVIPYPIVSILVLVDAALRLILHHRVHPDQ